MRVAGELCLFLHCIFKNVLIYTNDNNGDAVPYYGKHILLDVHTTCKVCHIVCVQMKIGAVSVVSIWSCLHACTVRLYKHYIHTLSMCERGTTTAKIKTCTCKVNPDFYSKLDLRICDATFCFLRLMAQLHFAATILRHPTLQTGASCCNCTSEKQDGEGRSLTCVGRSVKSILEPLTPFSLPSQPFKSNAV